MFCSISGPVCSKLTFQSHENMAMISAILIIIIIIIITIIMEICKAPTLLLKSLNKHTHIMYIEMEMLSAIKMYIRKEKKKLTHNVDKGSSVTMQNAK